MEEWSTNCFSFLAFSNNKWMKPQTSYFVGTFSMKFEGTYPYCIPQIYSELNCSRSAPCFAFYLPLSHSKSVCECVPLSFCLFLFIFTIYWNTLRLRNTIQNSRIGNTIDIIWAFEYVYKNSFFEYTRKKNQAIHSTGSVRSTLIKELVAVETNLIFIACKCLLL